MSSNETTEGFAEFLGEHADEPELGVYLNDLLIEAGMEKETLANRTGLSMSFVYQLLRGEQPLSRDPQGGVSSAVDRVVKALAPEIAQHFHQSIDHSLLRKEITDRVEQFHFLKNLERRRYDPSAMQRLGKAHWKRRDQIPAMISFGAVVEWLQSEVSGHPIVLFDDDFQQRTVEWKESGLFFVPSMPGYLQERSLRDTSLLDFLQYRAIIPTTVGVFPRTLTDSGGFADFAKNGYVSPTDDFMLETEIIGYGVAHDLSAERPVPYSFVHSKPVIPFAPLTGLVVMRNNLVYPNYFLTLINPSRQLVATFNIQPIKRAPAKIRDFSSTTHARYVLPAGQNVLQLRRVDKTFSVILNGHIIAEYVTDSKEKCAIGVIATDLYGTYYEKKELIANEQPFMRSRLRRKYRYLRLTQL